MESLFHIKCHRIIDQQQERVAVVIVECSHKSICFVESLELKELEILMFATNGDKDILKDNGRACSLFSFTIALI
jgi:hypothetical protein